MARIHAFYSSPHKHVTFFNNPQTAKKINKYKKEKKKTAAFKYYDRGCAQIPNPALSSSPSHNIHIRHKAARAFVHYMKRYKKTSLKKIQFYKKIEIVMKRNYLHGSGRFWVSGEMKVYTRNARNMKRELCVYNFDSAFNSSFFYVEGSI